MLVRDGLHDSTLYRNRLDNFLDLSTIRIHMGQEHRGRALRKSRIRLSCRSSSEYDDRLFDRSPTYASTLEATDADQKEGCH